MVAYPKIYKQAYEILRTNKFLWLLGLFFVWHVLGNFLSFANNGSVGLKIHNGLEAPAIIIATVGISLFYLRAKAGLIFASTEVLVQKRTGFRKSFSEGAKHYAELFRLSLIIMLNLFVAALILFFPVANLWMENLSNRAVILGLLALLIIIPLLILANFLNNLGSIFIVLYGFPPRKAIAMSFDLAKKYWSRLLVFSFHLGLLTLIPVILFNRLWSMRVAFLGNLSYNLLGVVLFLAITAFATFVACFQEVSWVILFHELVRPQKFEEEIIVPVPEVV